ncbi:glycosyltransferase family 2 protein [Candidatus Beckwithbacteria bacterium]|nr:glycosyltransferase family 2 protein [Candidatus Beckwithbacteria bacterium]
MKLSIALATYNEEENIADCLESVKNLADEIVIVDGLSTDKTVDIARKYEAKVIEVPNDPQFHANKQLAIEKCKGDWILQLDADERVSEELKDEIKTALVKENNEFAAYYLPRRNWFLTQFLQKGGVYPDYVIRLFRNGKGNFKHYDIIDNGITTSNVHAQISIDGKIGYLTKDLIHYGDKSIDRYFTRFNRYTSLEAENLHKLGFKANFGQFLNYVFYKPVYWFFKRFLRHRGYIDGFTGFTFALFSSLHYPVIYIKLWEMRKNR